MSISITIFFNVIVCLLGIFASSIEELSIFIKIQMIGNTILLLSTKSKRFISIGLFFFILLCIFHFGRLIFLEINPLPTVSPEIVLRSYKFSLIMISAVVVGYLFYLSKKKKDVSTTSIVLDDNIVRRIRKVSYWIIALTIIPLIYIDFIKIQYSLANGYVGIFSLGNENAFVKYASVFTAFTRPAVLLLIISYYKIQKKARTVLIAFFAYSILEMLSGARSTSMIYIVASLILYSRLFSFKKSNLIIILLLFFSTLYILPSITVVRQGSYSVKEVMIASNLVKEEGGQVKALLSEFGGTQISVAYAILFTNSFNGGLTYLNSLINISPKIPESILPIISKDLTYTNSFPSENQYTLGGSCIGEAYYNFGWFAPLFAFLLGMIIGRIDVGLCEINKSNFYTNIMLIAGLPFILLWVRGFFCTMIFPMFWVPLLYRFYIKKLK